MKLPERFTEEIKAMQDVDFPAFLRSYEEESLHGLRVNTGKLSVKAWEKRTPFALKPVPWVQDGFYYDIKSDVPSKDVYYYAGLYYLQEPSAMTPADRLPIQAGDMVLDLCAAPGGKATALGAKLKGTGCLVANDISASRANALLRNLERAGVGNCIVTAESPKQLAAVFPACFDKILVDAPCSGEGMFRREPSMIQSWYEKDSTYYAPLQREILTDAAKLLKPGGLLLYSTCTFSPLENEEAVRYLMEKEGFEQETIAPYEGFASGIDGLGIRIWPHRMDGEGHFLALLKKPAENETAAVKQTQMQKQPLPKQLLQTDFSEFMQQCAFPMENRSFFLHKDNVYLLPEGYENPRGIRILRSGLLLGTLKNKRFAPSQALAMTLTRAQFSAIVDFSRDDVRVKKYLKGETVELDAPAKGWQLVCVDGFPLGWGKAAQTTLKNKYAPGWRIC